MEATLQISGLSLEQQLDAVCEMMEKTQALIAEVECHLTQSPASSSSQHFYRHRLSLLQQTYAKYYRYAEIVSREMLNAFAATYNQSAQAA